MTADLILIRHAPVDGHYQGVCYGRSDVELGEPGRLLSVQVTDEIAVWPIRHLVTSGAKRTGVLADQIAERLGIAAEVEPALLERDFGAWELRPWDDIHAEVGDALNGLIEAPGTYRPPGGETTFELRDRVMAWYDRRPREGLTVAVTHGGPIAALRGTLRGLPPADWLRLVPAPGTWVALAGGAE